MAWNPLDALTGPQRQQLERYAALLLDLNRRINLISREDEENVEEHHLLHSLALTWRRFPAGSVVVDWGSGGGLPVIPLAIAFPDVQFHAVDAVDKKVRAVRTMARRLGLQNLQASHARAETWDGRAHFSVSRATAPLVDLWSWHAPVYDPMNPDEDGSTWTPGLICLKGGDLAEETAELQRRYPGVHVRTHPLLPLLERPFFRDKVILEVFEGEPRRS